MSEAKGGNALVEARWIPRPACPRPSFTDQRLEYEWHNLRLAPCTATEPKVLEAAAVVTLSRTLPRLACCTHYGKGPGQ